MSIDAYKMYIKQCIDKEELKKASIGYKKWKERENELGTNINDNCSKLS